MKKLINDEWVFAKLPCGSTISDAEKAAYEPVDLPHDWLIWQDDLYESADVWYKRIIVDEEVPEKVNMIRFDGVYMDCEIYLNGEKILSHPYGYTAFDVPLTGKLYSRENTLMVHIRHQSPNSRWYSGSGIFRDVTMLSLPENHLVPDGLTLHETEKDGDWIIDVTAEISGPEIQPFHCQLADQNGCFINEADGTAEGNTVRAVMKVPDGQPWSTDSPVLYRLTLIYGKETETFMIGLRSVAIHPQKGLFLNGKKTKLKGVCLHHDLGALGAAFHEKAAKRQLSLMKEMGVNAVRTSHNPPAAAFLDLCDEMGIMVIDEAFDMWERSKTEYDYARFFSEWAERDVASWVRRDRCHPCVIMWSVGNEIFDMHADLRGTELTKMLAEEVRKHDPRQHAFVTFGCNYMPWAGGQRCAEFVDAVGYNYGEKLYDEHHKTHPEWVIYGSETGSVLSSRGIYHFPMRQSIMSEADQQCSALGNSNTSWGANDLRKLIVDDLLNPYSLGQFIWSGIDYIGEPTPYHTRSCYFGQADTACYPKDAYYLFQSLWTDKKMIHIGVNWDWNPGQMIDIPVMTNCAEAEIYINGKSLGRKKVHQRDAATCLPVWQAPFEPGILEARAYNENKELLCTDRRITPGETHHLKLTSENDELLSDKWDLAFVTVSAEDENNQPVANARDRVMITVEGGGCLLGTDNGDSTDTDGYKTDCRRLFGGKLLLIIGSTGDKEDVHIHVMSNRGQSSDLILPCRDTAVLPGRSRTKRITSGRLTKSIPVRKLMLTAMDSTRLTKDHPQCVFTYKVLPEEASNKNIRWEVTNQAGIVTPYVNVMPDNNIVTVTASGDGSFYLRGLTGESKEKTEIISQIEFSAKGLGNRAIDAYQYISAGLYDFSDGNIGTGNEKGVAFDRDAESMIGFKTIDFGTRGSDRLTADIFALDNNEYNIELYDGNPRKNGRLITVLKYQKPSIWNVYQAETWTLPERICGIKTICFRMREKVHMKGFCFFKQSGAYLRHSAADADVIYGDSFRLEGDTVKGIGNNVTLTWNDLEFDKPGEKIIEIAGKTPLKTNTICIRLTGKKGTEVTEAADFSGTDDTVQQYKVNIPEAVCTVSFVFLPGSNFDFNEFRFIQMDE